MHEASIARGIITEVERLIQEGRITGRVRVVGLRVGRLTAVVRNNLEFLFDILAKGTLLEAARLEIEEVPIRVKCRACGAEFEVVEVCFSCPTCSSGKVEVLSGRELMIEAVEVE